MTRTTYKKILSANDVGLTGGHQGGILVPKGEVELLEFLPFLDSKIKNPDAWIECEDNNRDVLRFRFVYYNNKFHDKNGTRNEYRITHMTSWFRRNSANAGDAFQISREISGGRYFIELIRQDEKALVVPQRLRLKGWRRVH